MRRFILAGLVLVSAATVFDVPSADAQVSSSRNPWCLRDGPGGGRGKLGLQLSDLPAVRSHQFRGGRKLHPEPELSRRPSIEQSAPGQSGRRPSGRHLGLGRQSLVDCHVIARCFRLA